MYESGRYVAEHVEPVDTEQIQPNGVDLTLDCLFQPTDRGSVRRDGKSIADRQPVEPTGDSDRYQLDPGGYIARYGERVHIPDDHIGFIYPRSSLMRNGCMVNTAVWDAGYEGRGEGLLQVHYSIDLEAGARIAQLVLARAEHHDTYEGAYQRENL